MDDLFLELLNTFLSESMDFLDEIEPQLIKLASASRAGQSAAEKQSSRDLMNGVFRLVHSMKGNSATLELKNIANLAHKAENLLDDIRNDKIELDDGRLDLLCRTLDCLRALIRTLQETKSDAGHEGQIESLVEELKAAQKPRPTTNNMPRCEEVSEGIFVFVEEPALKAAGVTGATEQVVISDELRQSFVKEADELLEKTEQSIIAVLDEKTTDIVPHVTEAFRAIHSFKGNCGFMGLADMERVSHAIETVLGVMKDNPSALPKDRAEGMLGALDAVKTALANMSSGKPETIPNAADWVAKLGGPKPAEGPAAPARQGAAVVPIASSAPTSTPTAATSKAAAQAPAAQGTLQRADIRVDLRKLDQLINLVGELVIAESMVTGCPALSHVEDEQLERSVHHLRRITMDLQDISMSVRMIPVAQTFRKMIRLVHDICAKTGKKTQLALLGEDTEVDKTVIEAISDPLVHVVRNSLDHGLEMPDDRVAKGKVAEGSLTIEAKHEGGEVWIVVKDDGKGLDRGKILKKAREKGLITEEDDSKIPDEDAYRLIFEPGFSTADKVTDISGRGVGMDVVRKNIEKIKGRVKVDSKPGEGTVVIFQIPLTLAIIDGMLVRIGQSRYTIPLLTIRESIVATKENLTIGPDGQEYVLVRSDFIPVIRMHEQYKIACDSKDVTEGTLVVVDVNKRFYALLVDEVLGQQQTVIKALSSAMGRSKHVSGCTILGNGEISLIVDVGGLVETLVDSYEAFSVNRSNTVVTHAPSAGGSVQPTVLPRAS
jgi:two-component system chemotaxis sensor kinase CheA